MTQPQNSSRVREIAQSAAQRGEEFVEAVRHGTSKEVQSFLESGSNADYLFQIFGLNLFRLDLQLDDPFENGKLAPYDIQIEGNLALLDLGVLVPLEKVESGELEEKQNAQHGHLRRILGAGLLLKLSNDWQVSEVLPFNSDTNPNSQSENSKYLVELHQGKVTLALQSENLDLIEQIFLKNMKEQNGRYNFEELVNALHLWRDFKNKDQTQNFEDTASWAGGVEYLIALFDFHNAESDLFARIYKTSGEAVLDRAREIAQTLNVTQFDDRYSIHPDPVAHYSKLFKELGVQPERDERIRLAAERKKVFDTIEIPPDDADFFGPG